MRNGFMNLTKLQVEGLKETLDFLRNGYYERSSGKVGAVYWFILFHKSNGSKIRVYLFTSSIVIKKDGMIVKQVDRPKDGSSYCVRVDSQLNMYFIGNDDDESKGLILSSDSPSSDVE